MSSKLAAMRHVRGFDVMKPLSIATMIAIMLPLVLLPLLSIFIFGTKNGLDNFWAALIAPEAIFALKLSMVTSFWATVFNVVFGLFAAYVISRYNFRGRNAVIVTISLPTAIPTAVAGFALLLLWGPYGTLGRLIEPHGVHIMFTAWAIILANIFVTFPLAFGVIKPVFDTMSRSLEEASATIGATRWQTFWYVTLPSLRGAIVTGALLTFARAVGEFGSTILVSGNLAMRTQTAPLYIFAKFNEGQVEAANAVAIVLALLSFAIFSLLFLARDWIDTE
ncbi:MAG: sulfate/thiosulfate transport system permease protein [Acidobacteriota bacterium]|jgi:sulfate ABC transporter permease subunit|nr:sulfate/thiosulfate transport system permease protein [Acidobacteriota bacterium]